MQKFKASMIYSSKLDFISSVIGWKSFGTLSVIWSLVTWWLYSNGSKPGEELQVYQYFVILLPFIILIGFIIKILKEYDSEVIFNKEDELVSSNRTAFKFHEITNAIFYINLRKIVISRGLHSISIYVSSLADSESIFSAMKNSKALQAEIKKIYIS
jgi:hypothetical protein